MSEQRHVFLGIPAIIQSESMRELLRTVERVALTNAAVLITGESGSGKELVARALHQQSLRCAKPWVDVNCAALPEHLVESELFGYEKGAFSGADSTKQGLFELAHTGTIFLDEIAELESRMQVKLLRVLDGVPYYRLGGLRKISVDARVIAATNRDLESTFKEGGFRRDLYYRLSQVQLYVPPLRDRQEDIGPLAEFFLREHSSGCRLSIDAFKVLKRYAWPGNVRELKNAMVKASIMAQGEEITPADLPLEIRSCQDVPAAPSSNLERMEQQMIFQALAETGGHHEQAAQLLGISRRTLSRRLKAYGIQDAVNSAA